MISRTPILVLLAALAAAPAAFGAPAPHASPAHPAGAAAHLVLRSSVPADVPLAALQARLAGRVEVRAHVVGAGIADSVHAVAGDPRLRAAAEDAVRWYVWAPPGKPAWTTVHVDIDGRVEWTPLRPDVVALARDEERAGHWAGAIDAWIGALGRIGRHPTLRNEWAIREHVAALVARMKSPPDVGGTVTTPAIVSRVRQQKAVARVQHEDLLPPLDTALRSAPWWGDPYQWRAASELGAGRVPDAIRSLRMYRLLAPDSVARPLADRALAAIAAGDTIAIIEVLKREGRQYDEERPNSD